MVSCAFVCVFSAKNLSPLRGDGFVGGGLLLRLPLPLLLLFFFFFFLIRVQFFVPHLVTGGLPYLVREIKDRFKDLSGRKKALKEDP